MPIKLSPPDTPQRENHNQADNTAVLSWHCYTLLSLSTTLFLSPFPSADVSSHFFLPNVLQISIFFVSLHPPCLPGLCLCTLSQGHIFSDPVLKSATSSLVWDYFVQNSVALDYFLRLLMNSGKIPYYTLSLHAAVKIKPFMLHTSVKNPTPNQTFLKIILTFLVKALR